MKNIHIHGFLGAMVIVAGTMTSCSSYKHSHRLSQIPEKSVVIADKVGVELKVDENKVVQASSNKRHASPQDAKDEAYYNAIVNNNIHVLVDPIYKIQTSAKILIFGGKSTATVTGFAGYYQNPRSYKEIKDELEAEEMKAKQDAFDLAAKQMKQLKDDGVIKQNTTVSSSDSKTTNVDAVGKLQELSLNTLTVEAEYEVTKTTETTSLVDEYEAFLKGVNNPSSVGVSENSAESAFTSDEPAEKKKGFLSKLKFWKK
ncbi:MAG: hypothetical protein RIT43_2098 [Bacteroidota bacterium]|jgi:hypothetical protein